MNFCDLKISNQFQEGINLELLTINKKLPSHFCATLQEPVALVYELKKIVRELKEKNPILLDYKLMDVGLPVKSQEISHMSLYFIRSR